MGLWNTHGMSKDDEDIKDAIDTLGLRSDELEALVEHARKEQWVWEQMAKQERGLKKRKMNLIAKFHKLRMEKWIELVANAEMEYEEDRGTFAG